MQLVLCPFNFNLSVQVPTFLVVILNVFDVFVVSITWIEAIEVFEEDNVIFLSPTKVTVTKPLLFTLTLAFVLYVLFPNFAVIAVFPDLIL